MDSHDLEPITEENWQEAAEALCRAAMFYETLCTKAFETMLSSGLREEVETLAAKHAEEIDLFTAVGQHWRHYLEIHEDGS